MSKKTAELSAGLVAVKGAAVPPPADMPPRTPPVLAPLPSAPVTPPAPEPAAPPTAAPRKVSAAKEVKREEPEANLAPLNFRVSASFRRDFRTYAATHDLKLNELLRLSFEAYKSQKSK